MDNYNLNNQNPNPNNFDNNNPYYNPNNHYYKPPTTPKDNLALFSLILSIIGCITSMMYYISLPCTISAIVLAILSKNRIGRFEGKAVAGLCLGISGIVLTLFFFALMLSMLQNPDLINYMQEYMSVYVQTQ